MTVRTLLVLLVGSAGVWLVWKLSYALLVWRRLRGIRLVACPATARAAAVRIDVPHAVATALAGRSAEVRIATCSRWPAVGCTQPCVHDAQDERLTTRSIVERWFATRTCVYCDKPVGNPHAGNRNAALLTSDGITVEWTEVPADRLWPTLRSSRAVCWNCHVSGTFRRLRPHPIANRPRPRS